MTLSLQKSFELLDRAKKVVPAQTHTFSKGFYSFVEGQYPVFAESAKGSKFYDVDGNEFIDYMAALGPIILGYSNDSVNDAIKVSTQAAMVLAVDEELGHNLCRVVLSSCPGGTITSRLKVQICKGKVVDVKN